MCTLRELYGPGVEKVNGLVLLASAIRAESSATYRPTGLCYAFEPKIGRQRRTVKLPHRAHPIVSCLLLRIEESPLTLQ